MITVLRKGQSADMQLTNRQLFILSYLFNHPYKISGEHLASQADISVRTLQNEIQEICRILGEGIRMETSGRKGYRILEVSEDVRHMLLDQTADRHSFYMPEEKVNEIYTILLFADGYTSLETLANTLYLSKTSVYRIIENNRALREIVTVSKKKGLIIERKERDKRRAAAKVFDKDSQNPVARQLRDEYIGLDRTFRPILRRLFQMHRYQVSGEALHAFRRYLIITVIRSRLGYRLEELDYGLPVSSLMEDILSALREEADIVLTPSEIQDCQAHLNNLCIFHDAVPEDSRWITAWNEKYRTFVDRIHDRYGLDIEMTVEDRQRFLLHVEKLYRRVIVGDHDSNYHKREINRRYPMAVHLILMEFESCFGFSVPETEVSCLAMYIVMKLRKHLKRIDCWIVTEKNPSVAWHMKRWIEEHFSRHIREVIIQPHYAFQPDMARDDLLLLATSESVVLSCPRAILVKSLSLEEEYGVIDRVIQNIRTRAKDEFFAEALARYCGGIREISVRGTGLYDLLASLGIERDPAGYEFVLDTNAYLYPVILEGKGENRIQIIYLPETIFHRGIDLRYLILTEYYAGTMEMLDFYYFIQMLLEPGRLDMIRKEGSCIPE